MAIKKQIKHHENSNHNIIHSTCFKYRNSSNNLRRYYQKENVTVLTDISNISKIEVRGNVQLYISDGNADQVKVYNKYYAESALIKSRNGVLSIASYKAEKLVVWVTAADLRSVSVYDNADVKSFGDFSGIEFTVDLHNNATAKLSLDAFNAKVTVADQAKASISGRVNELDLKYNHAENVSSTNLEAGKVSKTQTVGVAAAKPVEDEFAGL
ncbi:hypothetical protein MgSA37_03362 [Mucilaginibacter gotjawali]|uniref:Putative auto-transporter adhesin head GIN domain-containing protein n=1 Tax=Mucilaginibacter gotjawali TaxID=1550579 RepID=A0A120MZ67_9SPHI|nr:hypothetical protein MgSA37_03362 [Mucilaginibacter gotjawali]